MANLAFQFGDSQVTERQVGGRVVPLDLQRARGGAQPLARVVVLHAGVGPVAYLVAVDPAGHMVARHDQRVVKPLEVVGHDPPGVLTAVEAAGEENLLFGFVGGSGGGAAGKVAGTAAVAVSLLAMVSLQDRAFSNAVVPSEIKGVMPPGLELR